VGVAEDIKEGDADKEKKAVGFFETRNMLNGFDVHVVSPDRGMTTYAPIVLMGILGLFFLIEWWHGEVDYLEDIGDVLREVPLLLMKKLLEVFLDGQIKLVTRNGLAPDSHDGVPVNRDPSGLRLFLTGNELKE
jgi:hypothetical protein